MLCVNVDRRVTTVHRLAPPALGKWPIWLKGSKESNTRTTTEAAHTNLSVTYHPGLPRYPSSRLHKFCTAVLYRSFVPQFCTAVLYRSFVPQFCTAVTAFTLPPGSSHHHGRSR